jgi:hypothetical protein
LQSGRTGAVITRGSLPKMPEPGNYAARRSFADRMKAEYESFTGIDGNCMDRQLIRVDLPPEHAGITAALRRAFEAAASEPCERDFAELLRRLN